MHKGTTLPKIELINSEDTTEVGTVIKIYYEKQDDEYKFGLACKQQLMYFDTVYFKSIWYTHGYYNSPLTNDFKIITKNHFKYRPDTDLEELHICLGKVYYPINWKLIGRKVIKIPVGLKFEVGELDVTPSREAIKYGDEAIYKINKKIDFVLHELSNYIPKTVELDIHENAKRIEKYWYAVIEGYDLRIYKDSGAKIKPPRFVFKNTDINYINITKILNFYSVIDKIVNIDAGSVKNITLSNMIYGTISELSRIQKKYLKELDPNKYLVTIDDLPLKYLYRLVRVEGSPSNVKKVLLIKQYIENYKSRILKVKDYIIPQEYIDENKIVLPDRKGKVKNYSYPDLKDLENLTYEKSNIIVYGFKGQEEYLEFVAKIHNRKQVMAIKIHSYMKEMVKGDDRIVSVSQYFLKHKYFRTIATAVYLRKKRWANVVYNKNSFFRDHLKYLYNDVQELNKFFEQTRDQYDRLDSQLKHEILELATKDNLFIPEIKILIDNMDRKISKLKLIDSLYLEYSDGIVDYFKIANLPVLPKFTEPTYRQKQLF